MRENAAFERDVQAVLAFVEAAAAGGKGGGCWPWCGGSKCSSSSRSRARHHASDVCN